MILLLDMDEVLVDFVGGACKVHGVCRSHMEHYRVSGTWDITDALGRAKTAGMSGLSNTQFWNPIHDAGVEFWENLEKLPWFEDVISWAESRFSEWYVVSAPSKETNSYTGKVNWLKRELGRDFDRLFITPHKELLAARDRLLLDDRMSNLDSFKQQGGEAMLFPTRGGPLYSLSHDPMSYLNQYLG